MNNWLPEQVQQSLVEVLRRFPVERVLLFGSRARGTHNEKSDVDLAIQAPCLNHVQMNILRDALEEDVDTLLKLDVLHLEEVASAELLAEIERDGRLLYP